MTLSRKKLEKKPGGKGKLTAKEFLPYDYKNSG
jgi:hypothetical protein